VPAPDLDDDHGQRHRHGRGELVEHEEQQVEQCRDHEHQQRRPPLKPRIRRQHRAEQAGHEQIAIAHRSGAEQLALQLRQAPAGVCGDERGVRRLQQVR
jgi:hypothetical protein